MTENLLIQLGTVLAWIMNVITFYLRYDLNRKCMEVKND